MDPENTIILDISSDEDETTEWNDNDDDDHKWLTDLLDEVSKDDDVASHEKGVVQKVKVVDDIDDNDDDCVVLESDPNESVSVRDEPNNAKDGEDGDEELVVVSEKGQVACRDYPHSRHLCIKFPFATTPNQNHCEQCYCYVCDSLAPCIYWGNGSAGTDHCHATDKDESWKLARKNTIKGSKGVQPVPKVAHASLSNRQHPVVVHRPTPPLVQRHCQIPRPGSIHAVQRSANFQRPNTVNQNRRHILSSMRKLHPDLASQMSARKTQLEKMGLGTQNQRLFKRTASSAGVATKAIRNTISSYRGNFGNGSGRQNYLVSGMLSGSDQYSGSLQPNAVNTSVPHPSQSQHYRRPTVNNPPFPPQRQFTNHLNSNVQSQVNSNPSPQSQPYRPPTVNNPPLPPQRQFTNHLNPNVQSQVNSNPSPQSQQYRPPTVNNPPLPPQPQFTNQLNPDVQSKVNSNLSEQSQQYRPPSVNNPPLPPQPQFTNHLNPNVQSQVSSNPFPNNLLYPVSDLVPPSSSQPQMASSQPSYTVPAHSSYSAPSQTQVNSLLVPVSDHTQNFSLENEAQSVVKDFLKDYGLDLPSSQDSGIVEGAGPVNESTVPLNLADYQYDWIFENQPAGPGLDATYGLTDLSSDSSFIDTGPIFDL